MARRIRVEYAGACYHVINRGNYRKNLFEEAGAAEAFLQTLDQAADRFGWRLHAYVVMRNHFHLALQITEPNLSVGMKWLQGTWVQRYNKFRRLVGRPFQGRYKALLVEPGHAFAEVCHYIHLNPVRARVVEAGQLQAFRWSSLTAFPEKTRPSWLEPSTVLLGAGDLQDTAKGWAGYRAYLAFRSADKNAAAELNREHLSRGWCVGSDAFRNKARQEFADRGFSLELLRFAGLDASEVAGEKESQWEKSLIQFARETKIDLARLPEKKSAPEKSFLAALLKMKTSASNRWLANRLQMGEPASASQFVRRWLMNESNLRQAETILSRVKM